MPFAEIFIASSSRLIHERIDRPLERIGGVAIVRPTALAELGDDLSPSLRGPILPQLELRAPAADVEPHRGELSHRAAIERTFRVERPKAAFGLVPGEETLLLGYDRGRVLHYGRLALEDH